MERPRATRCKLRHCDDCQNWNDSEDEYKEQQCCVEMKPKIVCPTHKHLTFNNYHEQQKLDNVIFDYIECYMEGMNRSKGDNMFVISNYLPI